jgi:glutaredoxin
MRTNKLLLSLVIMLSTATAQAQLYKWVGPDGKITYSDAPPPSSAKQVETKSFSAGGPSTAGLPYELAQAVKNNPVTLYTGENCAPCNSGRSLLNARGIPFNEKTVSTSQDVEKLRQISGETQLPVLMIGRSKQKGFEQGAWNAALTYAGYPETNQLPRNYSNGNAEPAAPVAKASTDKQPPKAEATASQAPNDQPPPPAGNAPPGFRF